MSRYLVDGFVAGVLKAKIDHGVLQRSAHVELQGQVVDPLRTNSRTQPESEHVSQSPEDFTEFGAGLKTTRALEAPGRPWGHY